MTANTMKPEEMERLYGQYRDSIYRYLLTRTGRVEVAEDLTSSVFIRFFKYLNRENAPVVRQERGFLYKVAKGELADFYRKEGKMKQVDIEEAQEIPDERDTADDQIDITINIDRINGLIAQLPETYQEVVKLRYIEQLEFSEISDAIEKSEGAVRVILHRALRMLKENAERMS